MNVNWVHECRVHVNVNKVDVNRLHECGVYIECM